MPRKKKLLKVKIKKGFKIRDAKGVQESFSFILKLIEERWTISEAVELANVDRKSFYKHISGKQKEELHLVKSSHTIYGSIAKMGAGNKKQPPPVNKNEEEEDLFRLDYFIEQNINTDWDF